MGSSCNKKKKSREVLYSEEFQALLDRLEEEDNYEEEEEEEGEEGEGLDNGSRRRRKLSPDQVKALEAKFEAERRLGPSRKAAIAAELGMEPRQVAVWFQNRRARCKSKQLEKEYSRLQAAYAALRQDYDSLKRETNTLLAEVKELEAKVEAKNASKGSDGDATPSTAALVSPAMMELLMEEASPPSMSSWWSAEDAYMTSQQQGDLINGEFGGMIPSATQTWDVFSLDQTFFC